MHSPRRSLYVALLLAGAAPCAHALDDRLQLPSEQEYWAQFERKDWDQAIFAAERLIEPARMNANIAPLDLADALVLLGEAQLAAKNYLAAEAAYSEALQILEPRVAATSDKLFEPLRGMGYSLSSSGKYEASVPYMERALIVSRRTQGLFNFNQQGVLRQLAATLAKLGRFVEADQQMQYLLRVGQQTYGASDPQMAGIFDAIGDFYMQAGLVTPARDAYREALRIVEKKLGRNDIATVQPLRAYADSFRRELFLSHFGLRAMGTNDRANSSLENSSPNDGKSINPRYLNVDGERALKRALKTLDAHPDRPPALLFQTLLDLGDWYSIKNDFDKALPYYRRAYEIIDELDAQNAATARSNMSFPMQVYYAVPTLATRNLHRPDNEVEERFVHVTFTVDADGAVKDESVLEQNASNRQHADTLAAVRSARYRPKFINGEPSETTDVSIRQVFRQRKASGTE